MRDLNLRREFAQYGVHFGNNAVLPDDNVVGAWGNDWRIAADANPHLMSTELRQIANDAQPGLVTAPNAGIPYFLSNIVDPQMVQVIFAPLKATLVFGEGKRGDWTTVSAQFPVGEHAGQVVGYGDYENGGTVDVNANWVARQSFTYQTHKRYGERQQALWGLAALNYSAELDRAVADIFARFQNRSYIFGIQGLRNYGMINDPGLIAPITPTTKAAGGLTWTNATANEEFNDVLNLFNQLLAQMGNNIDRETPMTLILSPGRESLLSKLTAFNVSAREMIQRNFPNLKIITVPEYTTTGGELMQLVVPTFQGVQTGVSAFTEKMRAHNLVPDTSSWKQKMSGGTWGTIIRRYIAIAQMLGI